MRILVIFTGGTIGSTVNDGWISPDNKISYTLIENYISEYGTGISFEVAEPYTILSENLTSRELTKLTGCVIEKLKDNYDGIIITHGTDTLQYSAAAIALAAGKIRIPVVFVSSNYPLDNEKANGAVNFVSAVEFIKSGLESGVFVSYKNSFSDFTDIHSASKLLLFAESTDILFSMNNEPVARVINNKVIMNPDYKEEEQKEAAGAVEFSQNPGILTVAARPDDGFCYNLDNVKAVVFYPYHSGTLDTKNPNLRKFCERAKGIPMFLPVCGAGDAYESTKLYDELGIKPVPKSTFVYLYMKIWIAISKGGNIEKYLR